MQQTCKTDTRRQSGASGSRTGSCAAREPATNFPCTAPGCAKVFSTARLLGCHQLRHEIDDDEITEVFCAICDHSARDHWMLAYHVFSQKHFDSNEAAYNAMAYFDLCEGAYNAIAQIRQLEEEEKETTGLYTRFYPFLRHPERRALRWLNPNPPAPPTPFFDLLYPLIHTLPPSIPDGGSAPLSDDHLTDNVPDVLPGLDTQDLSLPPSLQSTEPTLHNVWDPDHAVPAHLPDLGGGPTSFADDMQNFATYDLHAAYPLLDAGADTGAAEQVFAAPDRGYAMLDEHLAETIEKWDNASRW